MLNTNQITTREQWLLLLAEKLVPYIEQTAMIEMPLYRVSCSWPSKGGLSRRARVQGQCWAASASTDNHAEIFISPYEDSPNMVAEILAHELIHAALPKAGHGPDFRAAALAIGYTGPMRSTPTTPAFWEWVQPILDEIPPYPHKSLNPFRVRLEGDGPTAGPQEGDDDDQADRPIAAPAPQKNRQMKCTCTTCGYIARTSRKWIEDKGPPHCPDHGAMQYDGG